MGKKKSNRQKRKMLAKVKVELHKRRRLVLIIGILIFALVGAWVLNNSKAATPTASASCGATVSNYSYQVPFGNAVWNQPVCNLPRYAKSADYANRFIEWGHLNDGSASADVMNGIVGASPGFPGPPTLFDPDGLAGLFTREVYLASKSTTNVKIMIAATGGSVPSNLDGVKWNSDPLVAKPGYESSYPDTPIPWNPAWKTGMGGDNEMIILDDRPGPTMGRIYTIWGYNAGGCLLLSGDRICGMSINVNRDRNGNYVDYRTYEGSVGDRGVGISYYAGVVMPDEVKAKEIRHAIGISMPNTSYGSICTKAQLGTNAEGKTCGTAVAPASKFEWGGVSQESRFAEPYRSIYSIDKTIPEGMRFAIDLSYDDIESWIRSRPDLVQNPTRADTARTFAKAIRDYGMIVVDTNGARPDIQMAGGVNPENAQKWKDLGMGPDLGGNDLLKGLITKDNLYVVDPPTVTCEDGSTSKNFCKWTTASYGSIVSPPADTIKPTISITSPANNSQQNGQFVVAFNASDNVGVVHAEIFVDGVSKKVFNAQPYELSLNTSSLGSGLHNITVEAKDSAGNIASSSVSITVPSTTPASKPCDFDNNGLVYLPDLSKLLANWKKTVVVGKDGDCNGANGVPDGKVLIDDLGKLLALWKK
ncbi:MAG: Ig-like domain-containing protein [Candidatus Nomurabacteria bacterium]|nr:hypothetical protein [Candidatus Saccharibacteria bacterium]USN95157.1 MAG: Ig-like domain-containing protein [Candidatus Nomurabacteria bacterium]